MTPKVYFGKALCLMLFFTSLLHAKPAAAQQFLTTIDGWNAYVHLPDDYSDSVSKRYPLIIFIPGLGEVGTDPAKLLVYGPSKFISEGYSMNFMVNGKMEKPIVISIQPASAWPTAYSLNRRIDSMLLRFRVDAQRISGTGLSMGGWSWDNYIDGYSPTYTNRMAAVVAMSPPEPDNTVSNMRLYALGGGKWWGFEGNMDLRGGDKIRDTMNYHVPGSARYTLYAGNHCCWNSFYVPTYTENGESIYTWMLKQKRPGVTFAIPEADAGRDSTIPTPTSSLTLKGSGNDPVGNPINFAWTKISGPATGSILNPTSAQTNLTGLGTGTYQFQLKVLNNLGGAGMDTITIKNGSVVLPIKLGDFTGIEIPEGGVLLQWKTLTEQNSKEFILERSTDGSTFSTLTRIAAAGNSDIARDYSFIDQSASPGLNYYQLKMVDNDGKFEVTDVVKVEVKHAGSGAVDIKVTYIDNKLRISMNSSKEKKVQLMLADAMGRVLYRNEQVMPAGTEEWSRFIPSSKGVYYVRIITPENKITKQVYNQ